MLQGLKKIMQYWKYRNGNKSRNKMNVLNLMRMKENKPVLFSKNFLNSFFLLTIRKQKVLFHCILSAVLVHRICLEGTIKWSSTYCRHVVKTPWLTSRINFKRKESTKEIKRNISLQGFLFMLKEMLFDDICF